MQVLFIVLLLLSLVPSWVLFAMAVVLLWAGWQSRSRAGFLLVVAAALEGTVAALRSCGMSLCSRSEAHVVVDPGLEGLILLAAAFTLLVAGVVVLVRWQADRQVRVLVQLAGQAFVVAALAGNLHFVPLVSAGRTSAVSPDGRTEAMLLTYSAFVDTNGYVLYRGRGRRLWTVADTIGDILTECRGWTVRWDADGRAVHVVLALMREGEPERDYVYEAAGDRLAPRQSPSRR